MTEKANIQEKGGLKIISFETGLWAFTLQKWPASDSSLWEQGMQTG